MAKQIRYSDEFKSQAVLAYLQGNLSCNQISQNIHVHPNTLSAWIRQYKNGSLFAAVLPKKDKQSKKKISTNRDADTIFLSLSEIESQVKFLKELIMDYR